MQDPTREFRKVFVYAPPTAGPAVNKMLKDLGLDKTWDAEPVSAGTALRESGLTTILEAALASARSRERYIHTCSSVCIMYVDGVEGWVPYVTQDNSFSRGPIFDC